MELSRVRTETFLEQISGVRGSKNVASAHHLPFSWLLAIRGPYD